MKQQQQHTDEITQKINVGKKLSMEMIWTVLGDKKNSTYIVYVEHTSFDYVCMII